MRGVPAALSYGAVPYENDIANVLLPPMEGAAEWFPMAKTKKY